MPNTNEEHLIETLFSMDNQRENMAIFVQVLKKNIDVINFLLKMQTTFQYISAIEIRYVT